MHARISIILHARRHSDAFLYLISRYEIVRILLTSTRYRVGKLKANSFESVMMTIGGATRFRTARIRTKGTKQIIETVTAGHRSGPEKQEKGVKQTIHRSNCSANIISVVRNTGP